MAKAKAARKPKKLAYALIDKFTEGHGMYILLDELVEAHHEDLKDARIALAWNLAWAPDVDGRVTLGKCMKASDLARELAPYDFVILLQQKWWTDPLTTTLQRKALLDHELHHAAVKYDGDGEPVVDQRGRAVYRMRRHDLEEFSAVVERYGLYKRDLEQFSAAIDKARVGSRGAWPGPSAVRERLELAGADVPLEAVIGWTEDQRRDADVWARLRLELKRGNLEDAIDTPPPAFVGEAIRGRVDSQGAVPTAAATTH